MSKFRKQKQKIVEVVQPELVKEYTTEEAKERRKQLVDKVRHWTNRERDAADRKVQAQAELDDFDALN